MALDVVALEGFVVRAKSVTYVGGGEPVPASRTGSHDLAFAEGPWGYLDSYVGASDFLGQELVTFEGEPVWAMNYYGYLLRPDLIDAARTGFVIRAALSAMYAEGRFLGGFAHEIQGYAYTDTSEGDVTHFSGTEWISEGGERLYELRYHGGLVRD
ncbi:hypothetical protein CSO01_14700 [Cellulomonas soli]|uniref:DUF5680 domain-containing protein n=1 Tax=Cellulomonas soli TaxID=931535 RepID=A0A512PC21_9CELL|nr:hypothetical protein CSO01_14700 [Cellulomonas soli]